VVSASTVIVMAVDSSFEKRRACRASKDFVCVTESAGSKTEGVAGYFQGIGGVSRGLSRLSAITTGRILFVGGIIH